MSKFATMLVKNAALPLNENPGTVASAQPGTFQGPPPSASLGERFYDPMACKSYIYVKVLTSTGPGGVGPATTVVATMNGALAYWQGDPANFTVCTYMPYAFASTTGTWCANAVAGVFLGAVTSGNYTLIQTGGDHPALLDTTTTDVQGMTLVPTALIATTSGTVAGVAPGTAATYRIVGYPTGSATTAGTIPAYLVLDKDF